MAFLATNHYYGPWPLKSTGRQGCFWNSTCDIGPIDIRHGFQKYSDMRQGYFLKSTGDIAINKRQKHATLAFLKIDRRHGDPPSRAPLLLVIAKHLEMPRARNSLDGILWWYQHRSESSCVSQVIKRQKKALTVITRAGSVPTIDFLLTSAVGGGVTTYRPAQTGGTGGVNE